MATTDIYHVVGSLTPARHAVKFLGGDVDDGVQVDAMAAARVAANDTAGTFTAWIMIPDLTGNYCIFGAGDANAVDYMYWDVNAGKVHAKLARPGPDVAWDIVSTAVVLKAHQWHHVALVQDGNKPKLYVDGAEVAVTETDVTEPTFWFDATAGIDGAHIGAADSVAGLAALTLEFKGAISDVKYWSVALTADEVLRDKEGKAVQSASLQNHWDMDGDYVDAGLGADDGTAVGAILLHNAWSEFSSRLSFTPAAAAVVADAVALSVNGNQGHAVIIKAA